MANPGGTQQGGAAAQAALSKGGSSRPLPAAKPSGTPGKPSGYGLPCSKCHLYYSADLDCCPTCHTSERVAPAAPMFPPKPASKPTPAAPSKSEADYEREQFLKQFETQVSEAHAHPAQTSAATCKFKERHPSEAAAAAEICAACYERLQERVDALEGALHVDLKEAAQIVYDAVWANPSEPSKTYENAASALLDALRKRAGIAKARAASQ